MKLRHSFAIISISNLLLVSTASGQGIYAPYGGPQNAAMGGASTAASIDFGSSYWNPATLSGLERQEMMIGTGLIIPSIHYTAGLRAGSINGTLPTTSRYGTSRSDSGVIPGLQVGASFKLDEDSPLTLGLGIFGIVGGGVNFAGGPTVPTLGPRQPPEFFGLGPIYANMATLGIKPMASFQATDKLAVAFAPIITNSTVQFDPAFFAPGPVDQFGVATFPSATNSRPFWGAGFQLGLLYELNDVWNIGFSYISPLWQERWSYNSYTPNLFPRRIGTQAQFPAVYSWGVAYKGIERTIIDVDLRYFDYDNATLFGESTQDGGLGWSSLFAVAVGAKHQLNDRLALLAGYLYNGNPINGPDTLFNIQAPGIIQHTFSIGVNLRLSEHVQLTAGWSHGFRNSVEGPISQVPGTISKLDAQTDTILTGLNIQYGGKRKSAIVDPPQLPPGY